MLRRRPRYTEPLVSSAQSGGGGGTLLIRNTLGVEVYVQGLDCGDWRHGEENWDSPVGGSAEDGFSTESDGSGADFVGENPATTAVLSDLSRPTMLPAGQTVECRLPARSQWGDGVAVELVVYVPGFHTVSGVRVGTRGAVAYPLTQLALPAAGAAASGGGGGGRSRSARGVAERIIGVRNASVRRGLALVVDVLEKSTAASTSGGRTPTGGGDTSKPDGGLVAVLRSNVCVQNASASDVEVDMVEKRAAAAAVAAAGAGKSISTGTVGDQWASPGAGGGAAIVRLAPGARLALPLPVLATWRLRIVGDATHARSHPLRLSPALLDPAVPNALRLTGDMERNSVCLRMTKPGGGPLGGSKSAASPAGGSTPSAAATAPARGNPLSVSSEGALSPIQGVLGGKSLRVDFDLQSQPSHSPRDSVMSQDWGDGSEAAELASKSGGARPRMSPSPTPQPGTVIPTAGDWMLVVQPSYLVTNALPCAMEVEIYQPPLAAGGTAGGGERGDARGRVGSVGDGSVAVGRDVADSPEGRSDMYHSSDSDTESVASSATARQGGGKRRVAASSKASGRNPALDLFFLPTSVGAEEGGRLSGASGTERGSKLGSRSRGDDRAGGGGGSAAAVSEGDRPPAMGRQQRVPELESQHNDPDVTSGFQRVWKGLVGSGQEAKVTHPRRGSCAHGAGFYHMSKTHTTFRKAYGGLDW